MRRIVLKCPICGQKVTVSTEVARPAGKCPGCGTVTELPPALVAKLAARHAPKKRPAQAPAPPAEPAPDSSEAESLKRFSVPQQDPLSETTTTLDLFDAELDPKRKILQEYFRDAATARRRQIPWRLIVAVCLIGAMALLVAAVLWAAVRGGFHGPTPDAGTGVLTGP